MFDLDPDSPYYEREVWLADRGYEVVNVSRARYGVKDVESLKDIMPAFDVVNSATGERLTGISECIYDWALVFAKKYLLEKRLIKE